MTFYRCWPKHWLAAACKAGLAKDHGEHGFWFESQEMQAKLEMFAGEIQKALEKAQDVPRS